MTKFGGCGWKKQACRDRRCKHLSVRAERGPNQPTIESMMIKITKDMKCKNEDKKVVKKEEVVANPVKKEYFEEDIKMEEEEW